MLKPCKTTLIKETLSLPAPPSSGVVLEALNVFLLHDTNKTTGELGGPSTEYGRSPSLGESLIALRTPAAHSSGCGDLRGLPAAGPSEMGAALLCS